MTCILPGYPLREKTVLVPEDKHLSGEDKCLLGPTKHSVMGKKILVVCTGNACRSQMAEGYLRYFTTEDIQVYSAGFEAHGVNPHAIQVMAEDGIDLSDHYSKTIGPFLADQFDYIISVCDEAQAQLPEFAGEPDYLHLSLNDPAQAVGSTDQVLNVFRETRETVKRFVLKFVGQKLAAHLATAA